MGTKKTIGEEIHLRKKYFACLVAALALLIALAVPAFAEPEEPTVLAVPLENETIDAELTTNPEDGETTEAPPILIYATEPTTIGFAPIDGELLPGAQEDEGLLSQRNLTFGALGLAGLALLLSVIALARTRKKTAPNATGNYQKYF